MALVHERPAYFRLPVEVPAARPVPESEPGTRSPVPLPRTTDRSVFGISAAVRAAEYIGASPKQSIFDGVDEADFLTGVPVLAFEAGGADFRSAAFGCC